MSDATKQGELYEKIQFALDEASIYYSTLTPEAERKVPAVTQCNIKVILDVAKADYPTIDQAQTEYLRRVNKKEMSSGLDLAGVFKVLDSMRDAWFKKWFGEP